MTAFATRAPLQLIDNPHMMSEPRDGRRTSLRLADKEDAPITNGAGHGNEQIKKTQSNGASAKQSKAIVNGMSAKTASKRKPAYDEEEDDGFAFTRTRSKKAKAESVAQQPPTTEESKEQEQAELAPRRKSRKKSAGSPQVGPGVKVPIGSAAAVEGEDKTKKRRSPRHSGEHSQADPPALQVKKKRKDQNSGEVKPDQKERASSTSQSYPHQHESQEDHTRPIEITFDATKISLPFADTPIIRRNQEMRRGANNGSRRSSLGMRGRRASSLIDTGKSNALPHDEVESKDFYKHIESQALSEPRRMRQLLTWCGTRAMGEKPSFASEDSNARLAAREIQSQLLKDFSAKSELSDWFNRNECTPPPSLPKPNPKNLSNLAKIEELEQQIARLQTERQQWETLLQPPSQKSPLIPPLPPTPVDPSTIDANLLSEPTQKAALQSLQTFNAHFQPSLTATISTRIQRINQNLEFETDKLAMSVHALGAYKVAAERVADEILGASAQALERRDREGTRRAAGQGGKVGMRDVLRGLSRVIDR